MLKFPKFKKQNKNLETVIIKLGGLHCTSCAVNIDLTLEDIPGVKKSDTNYAKSELKISFDPSITDLKSIKKTVSNLGYQVN